MALSIFFGFNVKMTEVTLCTLAIRFISVKWAYGAGLEERQQV